MAKARHGTFVYPPDPAGMKGPVPRLDTLWRIERILIEAWEADEGPISLEEIKRRMGSKGIRHMTVRTCVDELARHGDVALSRSGVLWNRWTPEALALDNAKKWVKL
jgi:hypothetical protein